MAGYSASTEIQHSSKGRALSSWVFSKPQLEVLLEWKSSSHADSSTITHLDWKGKHFQCYSENFQMVFNMTEDLIIFLLPLKSKWQLKYFKISLWKIKDVEFWEDGRVEKAWIHLLPPTYWIYTNTQSSSPWRIETEVNTLYTIRDRKITLKQHTHTQTARETDILITLTPPPAQLTAEGSGMVSLREPGMDPLPWRAGRKTCVLKYK